MTVVYAGAALIAGAILLTVMLLVRSSDDSQTVGKSLALINGTAVGGRRITEPTADGLVDRLFEVTARATRRLTPSSVSERLTRGLDRAGHPAPWTVERLLGAKGVCAIIGAFLGLMLGHGLTISGVFLAVLLGVLLFFLPDVLIYNAATHRQEHVARGFAEALDMLTICVEAGQGFDAALQEVARNLNGPIAGELARMTAEIQIGTSRSEAFQGMGERVNLPEVKGFVSAISQADRLGIPIASVLREQTVAMRLARKQRAEAQAQKVTVKILFPLVLCIFPALMIVILGPGGIRIFEMFSSGGPL
ncbi:MAG TPA: type II secretion system F family protein [Flexivirga sp.]|uniref:type II secretion system F family protein n=1 Tax=Flexivirga sp. TaxID=1962927 RepID=UPI002BC9437E|nr:type II secretion system F family protein [Flexivirga sp.]HWC22248.1 type II secretion system F family protein [Flexivirga sp.]